MTRTPLWPRPRPGAVSGAAAVYGTSIDQGGCASHPGMAFPAILARALDVQIYNFGFSGNACLEPEMADVLARVPGLRLLVVDAEAMPGAWLSGPPAAFLARLAAPACRGCHSGGQRAARSSGGPTAGPRGAKGRLAGGAA